MENITDCYDCFIVLNRLKSEKAKSNGQTVNTSMTVSQRWNAMSQKSSFWATRSIRRHWSSFFNFQTGTSIHCKIIYVYRVSASRGVAVNAPASASTHCAYPRKNGHAEL